MPDVPEPSPGEVEAVVKSVESGEDAIAVPTEMLAEEPAGATPRPPEAQNLYAQILGMGMHEKIKLALRGNKDARLILIRDPSKMIRRLVLMNPRISDTEVISIARNRSADEELIRLITHKREWMRNYQIRHGLATNPKTPLVIAMAQLGSLNDRDIRQLAKSKNVSAAVAAQARRIVMNKPEGR
jgi:hypothetical protein